MMYCAYSETSLFLRNVPTLASSSFNKHGRILILFGKQHQHTFNKNLAIANRSCVSCAHNTSMASVGLITHDLEI